MPRLPIAFLLVLAAITPAAAQESCDVRSTVEDRGRTVVFQQLMFCGDADPVTTFTCTRGKKAIKVSLPIGDSAKGKGEAQSVTFMIDGKAMKRRLTVTSDQTSEIMLDPGDALWRALLSRSDDVPVQTDEFSTSVGLMDQVRKDFEEWRKLCTEP